MSAFHKARTLYEQGKLREALPLFQQALAEQPGDVEVMYRACLTLIAMRDYKGCARWLADILPHINAEESPPELMAGFHYNLGIAYEATGQWRQAARHHRQALKYDPNGILPRIELGSLAYRAGESEQGYRLHGEAIALPLTDREAIPSRAFVRMLRGDYAGGFADYETRWSLSQVRSTTHIPPQHFRWKGKDLKGKRIVVVSEQGIGDTIQMLRYLPKIKARGGVVTLLCQPQIVTLVKHNYPNVDVVPHGTHYRPARWWISMMSLPRVFGTTLETVPTSPYLKAPSGQVWTDRFSRDGMRRIGYVRNGNPLYMADHDRSAPPGAFDDLLKTPGCTFINLDGPEVRPLDMAQTADFYMGLDLVISVDTAARHLAGALGVPCWLLAQCAPYWVDGLGEISPWYSTQRIFRRTTVDAWAELMQRVRTELEA